MALSKKAAKSLAVSYAAFNMAQDTESRGIWAEQLLKAMDETGISFGSKPAEFREILARMVTRGKETRAARWKREGKTFIAEMTV